MSTDPRPSTEPSRESLETPSTPKAPTDRVGAPPPRDAELQTRMDRVLLSDIGINTLLSRLKQSISSVRDLSGFLKERAALEEKHFNGILRLTRSTQDTLGRPENRQGSFAFNYREIGVIHERMAKNSEDFAQNLLSMSEELQEMARNCEQGRKHWKHFGLEAEQKSQDADNALDKSKQRYFSLAEQYDRVRTGERQGGKFGLKGPKSAAQQEETLLAKAEGAEQDYRGRLDFAQTQRNELLNSARPQAVRELQNLIMECDAAASMQLQKFAVLNEKLLLGNGLCVSPLKNQDNAPATGLRSLREIAQGINNQKDFEDFVLSHSDKAGPMPTEIKYEKHPALIPMQRQPAPPQRVDSSLSGSNGRMNYDGQISGIVPNQQAGQQRFHPGPPVSENVPPKPMPGPGQNFYPQPPVSDSTYPDPYPGPPVSFNPNEPSLPQIGALSMAGGDGVGRGRGRGEPGRGATDSDHRGYPGSPQHQFGHQSPAGPLGPSSGPTVNQQVTSNDGPTKSPQDRGSNWTPASSSPRQDGHTNQGRHSYGNRAPATGPLGDVRTNEPAPQTGMINPDQQAAGRGAYRGPGFPVQQSDARTSYPGPGPGPGPGRQGYQPDPRGLPSQANKHGSPGPQMGAANTSPRVGPPAGVGRGSGGRPSLPPLRPVFGVPLDELFRRDGAAVPAIVYQCVQAVDLFGLSTEGIYRVPGSAQHIVELQALFDHDSSQVDFRDPTAFYNDIASVTTLLKHFFRDLPDPLLTSAQYNSFIQAAKIEEDVVRRDSLHAIINALPDPNYATLRTLTLHLNRVSQNSAQNRMTASNLAIVFGPTLMGGHGGGGTGDIQDAGWQARVVETILINTLLIFDDDD